MYRFKVQFVKVGLLAPHLLSPVSLLSVLPHYLTTRVLKVVKVWCYSKA